MTPLRPSPNKLRAAAAAWLLACVALPLHAQAPGADNPSPPSGDSDALYRQLGGQTGLVSLMDDFMARLLTDHRMQPFFKDANQTQLKAQLVSQLCEVSGGPCRHKGPDMKTAHASIDITKNDFNALVEVLQHSMDARGIPFTTQNRLLAKLAPMHRDIINTR